MFESVLFILIYFIVVYLFIRNYNDTFGKTIFAGIAVVHLLVTFFYFWYSLNNPADATAYYSDASKDVMWIEYWRAGYSFIVALLYPFAKWLGFSYFLSYLPFSIAGLYAYHLLFSYLRAIMPNVNTKWYLLLWMPQLHFFTCAIGKDAIIFLGISLVSISLIPKIRWSYLIAGIILTGLVRFHILAFIVVGLAVYFVVFSKWKLWAKAALIISLIVGFVLFLPVFNEFVSIGEQESYIDYAERRMTYNMNSGSSIDISDQNIIVKFFSFIGRPFFFDANSILMLEASFENIFWIIMFLTVLLSLYFKRNLNRFVLLFVIVFIVLLIPNAFIMTNLGIVMRQKTQLFPFLFVAFVFYKCYPQQQKHKLLQLLKLKRSGKN